MNFSWSYVFMKNDLDLVLSLETKNLHSYSFLIL